MKIRPLSFEHRSQHHPNWPATALAASKFNDILVYIEYGIIQKDREYWIIR